MKYYIELTLMDNPDYSPYQLWSHLYTQLHLALVEQKGDNNKVNIGVSFPQYRFNQQKSVGFLGTKLRLLAPSELDLQKLDLGRWLARLTDYLHIASIRQVPDNVNSYVIYKRKQVKTSAERLARHRVKRGDISYSDAVANYNHVVTKTNLPYVQMMSLSSSAGQDKTNFKLFIERKSAENTSKQEFSTYGLSSDSSVPEF
ncbi:CRISPR-associated endonuclease Csy4 [Orbus hercynius]|uniref:CRISPR-associated endonuclease Csy4 n=1 Tax=Orbus hercynius TaxID=593135 RepID=A0A495RK23_9GAMM|nr:type I-F CRISPR-associated endoribonuclease Cas6/Csy4 [Orbus hercynius]RKS87681.1 CRISPR-associated endonuclease Csy4 [Orbus hercynius]